MQPTQERLLAAARANAAVPARGVLRCRWGSRNVRVTKASHCQFVAIHLPRIEGAASMALSGQTFGSQRMGAATRMPALEGPPICGRAHWRHQRTRARVLRSRAPRFIYGQVHRNDGDSHTAGRGSVKLRGVEPFNQVDALSIAFGSEATGRRGRMRRGEIRPSGRPHSDRSRDRPRRRTHRDGCRWSWCRARG